MEYIFELKMKVRDYECDGQGIVNNANYQHYTEHTHVMNSLNLEVLNSPTCTNKALIRS